jgi:hypothetical protein
VEELHEKEIEDCKLYVRAALKKKDREREKQKETYRYKKSK